MSAGEGGKGDDDRLCCVHLEEKILMMVTETLFESWCCLSLEVSGKSNISSGA